MARPTDAIRAARSSWRWNGSQRPPFAIPPGPGRRSVWDFPRPPSIEDVPDRVVIRAGERVIADTLGACRVCETASPPTYYLPPADVDMDALEPAPGSSLCEWKGEAVYFDLVLDSLRLRKVAWAYPDPFPEFEAIRGKIAFYPSELDCRVADERVRPQPGGFYGGWVTADLVGPFKGEPGTSGL